MKTNELIIDGKSLSLEQIDNFIINSPKVILSENAKEKINKACKLIDKWINEERAVYGVTTGFGEFANVKISTGDLKQLQKNLILSHASGVGELLPPVIIKIMMLLRVNALALGNSGIRLSTINLLIEMINNNIIPAVPSQGSVGSSGDLVPLAHMVLAMIGFGKVQIFNKIEDQNTKFSDLINSKEALEQFGLIPVELAAKEGLALINGTQMMTAFASYICIKAKKINKIADISAALTHEALRGGDRAYDLRLHKLRPHKGQISTAENMLNLINGSEIRQSHKTNDSRVQDSYSLRCIPQIHGASRDTINYVCSVVETEINSVTDNPLIFTEEEDYLEGGNFHGQPIALVMDFMGIALSELANVAERRIERMVNGSLSMLPRFLTPKGGLNSGLMIAQYTAASLVSENKVLSHPASVDSIPTSANQEDHNSMGSIAARKCFNILNNVTNVLAIELFTASQGVEFLKPLKCGKGTTAAYNFIRKFVEPLNQDRVISDDIYIVKKIIDDNSLLTEVQKVIELN
ncbi:MAG TPA: histidine ammonia-lyase [Melioribacteraceae bacterium]|nr:histidine ammonia-lyase [Melioribacteraceae bacterium]